MAARLGELEPRPQGADAPARGADSYGLDRLELRLRVGSFGVARRCKPALRSRMSRCMALLLVRSGQFAKSIGKVAMRPGTDPAATLELGAGGGTEFSPLLSHGPVAGGQ